jgi:hypothetical protein
VDQIENAEGDSSKMVLYIGLVLEPERLGVVSSGEGQELSRLKKNLRRDKVDSISGTGYTVILA